MTKTQHKRRTILRKPSAPKRAKRKTCFAVQAFRPSFGKWTPSRNVLGDFPSIAEARAAVHIHGANGCKYRIVRMRAVVVVSRPFYKA